MDGADSPEPSFAELLAADEAARRRPPPKDDDLLPDTVRAPARRRTRRPLGLPGGVVATSVEAAEFWVRASGAVVLVDGYNVAMGGWPNLPLELRRERCVAGADDVMRRTRARVHVVFDGADVVGVRPAGRLAQVTFSADGVEADEVLVGLLPAAVGAGPVVVVSDDRDVADRARAAGANVVSCAVWLALTGHHRGGTRRG